MTEGWTWPFTFTPRGSVYDADRDSWEEMSIGMREGWTGASAVVGDTLFVVSEYGEGRVKAYDPAADAWSKVAGGGLPVELKKPYAVVGAAEGRIYVVGKGMDVGVGRVAEEEEKGRWRIDWEVVKGPKALGGLAPCNAQVLYA